MSARPTDGDLPRPRGFLWWVSRTNYDRLRGLLDEQTRVSEALQIGLAQAEERDRARNARIDAVLGDAATIAGGLERAVSQVAALVAAEWHGEEHELVAELRALFPRRVERVEVVPVGHLQASVREGLAASPDGCATWTRDAANGAGEPYLQGTAALAGERAVILRYADGMHRDGSLVDLAERICRAIAASLESRNLARVRRRRLPTSMLGDEQARLRYRALREAQEQLSMGEITAEIRVDVAEKFTGVFGEAAWDAALFDLAVRLDYTAREAGGEAFEVDGGFVCLVPSAASDQVSRIIALILEDVAREVDPASDLAQA